MSDAAQHIIGGDGGRRADLRLVPPVRRGAPTGSRARADDLAAHLRALLAASDARRRQLVAEGRTPSFGRTAPADPQLADTEDRLQRSIADAEDQLGRRFIDAHQAIAALDAVAQGRGERTRTAWDRLVAAADRGEPTP